MLMQKINTKKMCLVCAAALTVVMGSGCLKKKEEQTAAEVEKIVLPTKAAVAVKRDITQTLNFSGNMDAFRRAAMAPALQGSRVQKIYVEEGAYVQEGQLLARMEDYQLQQSAAQLAQLEADYKRIESLHSRGSATAQQFDQIKAGYNAAKAGFDLLKKSVELRAPFAGTIIGRHVNEGELYTGAPGRDGVSGIVSVAQLGRIKIEVMVPEQDFVHLRPGQTAHVKTEAYPDTVFEGKIFTVNPSLNQMSRTSRVVIEITNNRQLLKPGMFAKVEIVTGKRSNVLAVPASAVIMRDGEPHVFTVENNTAPYITKPALVKIKTGMVTDKDAQILSGIEEGAVVLTDNNVSLTNNTDIRVTAVTR